MLIRHVLESLMNDKNDQAWEYTKRKKMNMLLIEENYQMT